MASKKKIQQCIACGLKVEYTNWAAGPVCYPCYFGAKLEYENGITNIEQIPVELRNVMKDLFEKNGYDFPFDLIESWKQKHYRKCNTMLRRWWSPNKKQEAQDDKEAGLIGST